MILRATYPPDRARELLEQELSKPEYQEAAAPWWLLLKWWFEESFFSSAGGNVDWVKVLSTLLVVIVVLAIVTYLVRANWARRITAAKVTENDDTVAQLSDAQVLANFNQAVAAQDYHQQVVWGFRCLSRTISDPDDPRSLAGLTAFEVAEKAGLLGFAEPQAAMRSADIFTRALYGHKAVTAQDAAQVVHVLTAAQQVRATKSTAKATLAGERT